MKVVCIIPIKKNSERVPGKNFRILCGRKLYEHILDTAVNSGCFDDVYVDTNSEDVEAYASKNKIKIIKRLESLASNSANGNDLLSYHYDLLTDYDYYFQLFATAPFLQRESIQRCCEILTSSNKYDSCFTAIKHNGFYWFRDLPINYMPMVLPRSQDMSPMIEETTGLYGITKEALQKYRCRIGARPYMYFVNKFEAVDINTEEDFKIAEIIGEQYWGLGNRF